MSEIRPRGRDSVPRGTGKKRHRAPKAFPVGWEHPPCLACGGPVKRQAGDSPSDWRRRQTCSHSCAARRGAGGQKAVAAERLAAAIAAHPPCTVCGEPITEKLHRRESLSKFIERATCSPRCGRIHHARACSGPRGPQPEQSVYRKGELVKIDFAGGFGRQTVRERPDPRSVSRPDAARSYSSVASAWLL